MRIHFYKYHGAGNDFIIIDGRKVNIELSKQQVSKLCNRHYGIGADGIIILSNTPLADFRMQFFNPDGTTDMMCGNGGRCIVMFAKHIGILRNNVFSFLAPDGIHFARVIDSVNVALKMVNTNKVKIFEDGIWIDSGTSHFVTFVKNINKVDVFKKGKKLRNEERFEKYNGANINFAEQLGNKELVIRTYEKGVENETLSCGTGMVASALAYAIKDGWEDGKHLVKVHTHNENLTVEFNKEINTFNNVILTGNAIRVFEGYFTV
ncbi:MAG: diaminopimelate epimerase [Bacteroidales bacterium]